MNGLIEQYGNNYANTTGVIIVNLLVGYSNTNYNIMAVDVRNAVQSGTSTAIFVSSAVNTRTEKAFSLCQYNSVDFTANWKTVGY